MNCVANLILSLLNFGLIALLPRQFFKQGARLTIDFWITAAPLFASPLMLMFGLLGLMPIIVKSGISFHLLSILAVLFNALSILVLGMALGSHRAPVHMFHDTSDESQPQLVTDGPYRLIRHPIYSAYLLSLLGAMCCQLQVGTIACFFLGCFLLNRTAAAEEQRLSATAGLGEVYVEYMRHTGRFCPPLTVFQRQPRRS
jgi:protein-S-isoprenylcysteine O-methyltransferase Ste14